MKMSRSDFFKQTMQSYFIIVTGITLVMGFLGVLYQPEERMGYEAFFSPLIFGVLAVLPSIALYSKNELTINQMKRRKIFQLLLLEGILVPFCLVLELITVKMLGPLALSIFLSFVAVHGIQWLLGNKKARELTRGVKAFQQEQAD